MARCDFINSTRLLGFRFRSLQAFAVLGVACLVLSDCNNSKSEQAEDEDEGFTEGSQSTVVTGANLTDVTSNCLHSEDEASNFQSLQCKILLKNAPEADTTAALLVDDFIAVTAVDGIDIAWGVPPDLNFICNRVRQSTELFCFRESDESLQDFSVLLSVSDLLEPTNSFVVTSTAVSSSINQEAAPEAPSGLSAVAMSSTQINLTYVDNSSNETSFAIERSLDEVTWVSVASVASDIEAFSNSSLSPSVQYFYRVRACNAAGCSAFSSSANATTAASGGSSHILFVTSTTYSGNLGGLAGADSICSTRAAAASLTGTWKAILSTAAVAPIDRISISGEIRNTNNDVLAQDEADLWDETLDNPVRYDEFGNAQNGSIWTGSTDGGGGVSFGGTCVGWTEEGSSGEVGIPTASNYQWSWVTSQLCTNLGRVYCIDGQ